MVKIDKSGRSGQVLMFLGPDLRCLEVVFSTKIAWAGFNVVVIDRWSLFGGGR